MSTSSALRPLVALAAGSLVLCAVVIADSANGADQQSVASAVGPTFGCGSPLPDNPATGSNLGPLFQRAV